MSKTLPLVGDRYRIFSKSKKHIQLGRWDYSSDSIEHHWMTVLTPDELNELMGCYEDSSMIGT
jgi:hypothetical protein